MTKEELITHLQDIEWDDFEAKQAQNKVPANVWETVSAFSNTSGGWIVFGIRQDGMKFEVQGVTDGEHIESDFLNTLRGGQKMSCKIFPDAHKYSIDGKTVLAFHIPSSPDKPVYFGGTVNNTFIRSGSGDRRATNEEIAAMYRDQMFGVKSEQFIDGSSLDDLSMDALHDYRAYLASVKSRQAFETASDDEFCRMTNIADREGRLSYAGLMMFGKGHRVTAYIPTFCVDYIEIPGNSIQEADLRYTYRIPEQENIWNAYRIISRRLLTIVDVPFKMDSEGRNVGDTSQYLILREALANFLMHADQFNTLRSCIHVYTNRIEFVNGGSIPVNLKEIEGRAYTNPRNPTVARLFRFADIAENVGFGLNTLRSWKFVTGRMMEIESALTATTVSFDLKSTLPNQSKSKVKSKVKSTVKSKDKIKGLMKEEPAISLADIADVLGMSLSGVEKAVRNMKTAGEIERKDGKKGGTWIVL